MGWRDESVDTREAFLGWVHDNLQKRVERGVEKYGGDGFKGDPLEHLAEELFDALYYAFYAMRERVGLAPPWSVGKCGRCGWWPCTCGPWPCTSNQAVNPEDTLCP